LLKRINNTYDNSKRIDHYLKFVTNTAINN
jgi:hypothetical protein